jgi:hypothetical protein
MDGLRPGRVIAAFKARRRATGRGVEDRDPGTGHQDVASMDVHR